MGLERDGKSEENLYNQSRCVLANLFSIAAKRDSRTDLGKMRRWLVTGGASRMAVNYASYKPRIKSELMKLARAGKITYYGVLGAKLGKHPQWHGWTIVLGEILLDQTRRGEPDITSVLLRTEGWPGQVDGVATKGRPTPAQKK